MLFLPGLLDPSPHSLSFFAAEPTKLIGFFKPDLLELLDTQPEMGCKILLRFSENMARILRDKYADLCDLGCEFEEFYSKSDISDLEE